MSNLRFLVLSATASFDGVAPLTNSFVPDADNPKQPRSVVTQASIGRLSFSQQMRPGSVAALVRLRSWSVTGLEAAVRAVNEDEDAAGKLAYPDDPLPIDLDATLKTITLTSTWSEALLLGPTDALTLRGNRGTVEAMVIDLTGAEMLSYINAVESRTPAPTIDVQTITTTTALSAWSGDRYIFFEPATGGATITLPDVTLMTTGARAFISRTGGAWGLVSGFGTNEINGSTSDIVFNASRGEVFELVAGEWVSTAEAPISPLTITNATPDGGVLLTVVHGVRVVRIRYSANGSVQLPPGVAAGVGPGDTFILIHDGDDVSTPIIPALVTLLPTGGDAINGIVNQVLYFEGPGSIIICTYLGGGDWSATGMNAGLEQRTITVTGTTWIAEAGWRGTIYFRCTNAALTTLTLPVPSLHPTPIGCRAVAVPLGVAGIALAAGVKTIVGNGANAATLAKAQYEPGVVEWDGTTWALTGTG